MEEVWKEIKNNKGFYISNLGRVKTDDRYVKSNKGETEYVRIQRGRILKGGKTIKGYCFVTLLDNKHHFIHQLVAQHFIPNPNNYKEINHLDENPQNNCVNNLQWCTHQDNCNYGNRKKGNQDKTKKVAQYDLDGNLIKIYKSLSCAEQENNVPKNSGIGKCCRLQQKTYKGYIWKYQV